MGRDKKGVGVCRKMASQWKSAKWRKWW